MMLCEIICSETKPLVSILCPRRYLLVCSGRLRQKELGGGRLRVFEDLQGNWSPGFARAFSFGQRRPCLDILRRSDPGIQVANMWTVFSAPNSRLHRL